MGGLKAGSRDSSLPSSRAHLYDDQQDDVHRLFYQDLDKLNRLPLSKKHQELEGCHEALCRDS